MATALVLTSAKILGLASAELVVLKLTVGVVRGVVEAEALARWILVLIKKNATNTQAASIISAGSHLRSLLAATTQTISLIRQAGIIRFAVTAIVVSRVLVVSVIRSTSDPQSVRRTLVLAINRSTTNAQAAARVAIAAYFRALSVATSEALFSLRQTAAIRSALNASTTARILLVSVIRSASDAQMTSRSAAIALAKRSIASAQTAARTLLVSVIKSATDGETNTLSRTLSRPLLVTAATVQTAALIRAMARVVSTASSEVAELLRVSARFRSLSVAASNVASRLDSVGIIRSAASVQSWALLRLTSIMRGGSKATLADIIARPAKLKSVDAQQTQSASLLRQSTRIIAIASAQAVALARVGLHFLVSTLAQAQPAALLRLTSIIRGASEILIGGIIARPSKLKSVDVQQVQSASLTRQSAHLIAGAITQIVALLKAAVLYRAMATVAQSAATALLNTISKRLAVTQAQALASSVLAAFRRSVSVASAQTVLLLRLSARVCSTVTPETGTLKRVMGSIISVGQAQSLGLVRLTSIIRGAFHAVVAEGIARPSKLKSIDASDGQVTALLKQPGRLAALGDAQVAALKKVVAVIRSTAWTQGVAAALSVAKLLATASAAVVSALAMRAILRAIAASSNSAARLLKTVRKSLDTAATSVAGSAHSIALSLHALVAQVATDVRQIRFMAQLTQQSISALSSARVFFQISLSWLLQATVSFAKTGVKDVIATTVSPSMTGTVLGYPRIFSIVSRSVADFRTLLHRFLPLSGRRRVVRLPAEQLAVTLPPSRRRVVLPTSETLVMLPPSVRRVLLPREEEEMSDYQITHPEPAFFSPFDPTDQETFTFDWSDRGHPGDTIVFASVVSLPTGVNFVGPAFIDGSLVEITVGPFASVPQVQPVTYRLRCMAVFASGRISNFSVPFQVKSL